MASPLHNPIVRILDFNQVLKTFTGLPQKLSLHLRRTFPMLAILLTSYGVMFGQPCGTGSAPKAKFTFNNDSTCAGSTISFTNSSTGQGTLVYTWKFGDSAGKSTATSPSYIYSSAGVGVKRFTVTLIVKGPCGVDSVKATVRVLQVPKSLVADTCNIFTPFRTCTAKTTNADFDVCIKNMWPGAKKYTLDYGDGSAIYTATSFKGVKHTYKNLGVYTLTATIETKYGCKATETYEVTNESNPSVGVSSNGNTIGCLPQSFWFKLKATNVSTTTKFTWDFGDGTPTVGWDFTKASDSIYHTFNTTSCGKTPPKGSCTNCFVVSVRAINACDTTTATVDNIKIFEKPKPDFTFSGAGGCAGKPVSLTNKTITNCVSNTTFQWDFGDGTSSTSMSPQHSWSLKGVYKVKLITKNSCGVDTMEKTLTIDTIPKTGSSRSGGSKYACVPQTVSYTDTTKGNKTSSSWTISPSTGWSFTGGTSGTSANAKITFTSAGRYIVTQKSGNGCGTSTKIDTLFLAGPPSLTIDPIAGGCAPYTFQPIGKADSAGKKITAYKWRSPSATDTLSTLAARKPLTYTKAGIYTVYFEATNACGTSKVSKTFTVYALPVAFVGKPDTICGGSSLKLGTSAVTGNTYAWKSRPVGFTSTLANPTVSPTVNTSYILTQTGPGGCVAKDSVKIDVVAPPIVTVPNDTSFCLGVSGFTLRGGLPLGGTWSGTGVTSGKFVSTGLSSGTYNLTYSYSKTSTGCTGTAIRRVTIRTLPVVIAGINDSICMGSGNVSLVGKPLGGKWSGTGVSANTFFTSGKSAGSHRVTYTYTDQYGCIDSSSKYIVIRSNGAVNAGKDTALCIGSSWVSLQGSPSGGTFSGKGVYGTKFYPDSAKVGSHKVYYTTTAGLCTATDSLLISVFAKPIVNAGVDDTLCISNSSITLQGQSPSGGAWKGKSVTSAGIFTPSNTGVYTLTYIASSTQGGCKDSDIRIITVVPKMTVSAGGPDSFCINSSSIKLTGASPSGGYWKGKGVDSSGYFNPNTAGTGAHLIYYLASNAAGCTDSASRSIYVSPLPTVNAGLTDTVCIANGSYSLSGFTPTGGLWSGNGVSTAGVFNPSLAGTGSHTLTYKVSNKWCAASATKVVVVDGLPSVYAGKNDTLCVSQGSYKLSSATPSGGWWTGTGVSNAGIFTPSTAGVGSWVLTYHYQKTMTSCLNKSSKVVRVEALPVVSAGGPDSICLNTSAYNFKGYSPSGGKWYGNGVTTSGNFDPATAGTGQTILWYKCTNTWGCTDSAPRTVQVLSTPTVWAGTNDTLCVGGSSFSLTGFSPKGGIWSGKGVSSWGNFSPSATGIGTFKLTYSVTNGSCTNTDTKLIVVRDLPQVATGLDFALCAGEPDYQITSGTPAGGTWSGKGVSTSGLFSAKKAGVGAWSLTYTYKDKYGCSDQSSITVKVNSLPLVSAGGPDTFCVSTSSSLLSGSNPSGGTWKGIALTSSGSFDPSLARVGSHTLWYYYTNTNGCTDSAMRKVEVQDLPIVNAGKDSTVCLSANPFSLAGGTPLGGTWTGIGVSAQGVFDPGKAGIGSHKVVYTFSDKFCTNRDTLEINVPLPISVKVPADTALCAKSADFTLSGGKPTGGIWMGTGVINGKFSSNAAGIGSHTLRYRYIDPSGCGSSAYRKVTVHALPTVWTAGSDTVCAGGVVLLDNYGPSGGSWSGKGIIRGTDSFLPGVAGVGTHRLVYTFTNNFSCADSAPHIMVVKPLPIVSAGLDDSLCLDANPLILTGFSPANGKWSGRGFNASTNTFLPMVAGVGKHTLTYTWGNGTCVAKDTKIIKVFAKPIVNAGNGSTFCLNSAPRKLSGNTPSGGYWKGRGIDSNGLFHPRLAGLGDHWVTYFYQAKATACSDFDSTLVVVNPAPQLSITADTFGCPKSPLKFRTIGTNIINARWSFGDGDTAYFTSTTHAYKKSGTYLVQAIGYNVEGCTDTLWRKVRIGAAPVARLRITPKEGIGPLTVLPQDSSLGEITSWAWDFGNGRGYNGQFPDSIMYTPGNSEEDTQYVVSLLVKGPCGVSKAWDTIKVYKKPVARFGIDQVSGCAPLTVHVNDLSEGSALAYAWDFGDGRKSNLRDPGAITYITTNDSLIHSYTIKLNVTNRHGRDSFWRVVTVRPNLVRALFEVDAQDGCSPLTVKFLSHSRKATRLLWNFGDGWTSSITAPIHTFTQEGTYKVRLIASNECTSDTFILPIVVHPGLDISFIADASCVGRPIKFYTKIKNVGNDLQHAYSWEFGDGAVSEQKEPLHAYAKPGKYTVTLSVRSALGGCTTTFIDTLSVWPPPAASFIARPLEGCKPLRVLFSFTGTQTGHYRWDFGDGNMSADPNPIHTYYDSGNYPVKLSVYDKFGCNNTLFDTVHVYPYPVSDFSIPTNTYCGEASKITLDNKSKGAAAYLWDFGNGNTSTSFQPKPTYDSAGSYTIRLVVYNAFGCSDTSWQSLNLYAKPVAMFEGGYDGCAQGVQKFRNLSRDANSYHWDFGDGGTSSIKEPLHQYNTAGQFMITLVATGPGGCSDTFRSTTPIVIYPKPDAHFTMSSTQRGNFNFKSAGGNGLKHLWTFGDGSAEANSENASHSYSHPGIYYVSHIVTSSNGCIDTAEYPLSVDAFGDIFVPNALTPFSGPDEARLFLPKATGLMLYHLRIFNAWGELLWESNALEDGHPAEGWNGTYNGGDMPQDVYVWKIEAVFENGEPWTGPPTDDGRKRQPLGTVTLIR